MPIFQPILHEEFTPIRCLQTENKEKSSSSTQEPIVMIQHPGNKTLVTAFLGITLQTMAVSIPFVDVKHSFLPDSVATSVYRQVVTESIADSFSDDYDKQDPSWEEGSVELLTINAQNGGHTGPVRAVSFHPEGRFFASSGSDRNVKTWDLQGKSRVRVLPQDSEVLCMQFSPDGRWLATGSLKGIVKIWNWRTGEAVQTLSDHTSLVTALTFTPDGGQLISGSGDRTLKVWDVGTGENKASIRTGQFIQAIVLDPQNPQRIASAGLDKKIEIWNLQSRRLEKTFEQEASPIYALDWRPNSQQVAFSPDSSISPEQTNTQRNTVVLFDLARGRLGSTLRGHSDYISFLKFSPSGETLLSGSWDESIKLWNTQTGELVRSFLENERRILSGDFSNDGKAFIVGSGDGTVKVYQSQK